MCDWRGRLAHELAALDLPPERRNELVEELALDLEERSRSARLAAASEEEADVEAWAGLGSLNDLRTRLAHVPRWAEAVKAAREAPPGARGGGTALSGLGQDLRLALRSLRRSPGSSATALLTLALGIGANTTLFGVVDALFLTSLPVRAPEVWRGVRQGLQRPLSGSTSYLDFEDLRRQPHLFESLVAYSIEAAALSTAGEPVRVWCELVSGNFFPSLSVAMSMGRPLGPPDDREDTEPAVVISHGLWERRLGADPAVIGRHLNISGTAFAIVGVAPPGFAGLTRGLRAEAWIPLALRGSQPRIRAPAGPRTPLPFRCRPAAARSRDSRRPGT
jgi:hypothetical protein